MFAAMMKKILKGKLLRQFPCSPLARLEGIVPSFIDFISPQGTMIWIG